MIKRCHPERYALAGLVALLGLGLTAPAVAQDDAAAVPVLYSASDDTVRTNLWLFEALMSDVILTVGRYLPPPPAEVELVPMGDTEAEELMLSVASRQLSQRGYQIYAPLAAMDAADTNATGGADDPQLSRYRLAYRVVEIELSYPDTGRRMGIWRQWVQRELQLSVAVELSESDSGRLLASERITRRFGDRVPDGDFTTVDSPMYSFTSAETGESGWRSRMEEIVVLGTLAGLVAVYFANTQ